MKQSQFDPTLKEHFTENEARNWIRHLEKIIETLDGRLKKAREKTARMADRNTYHSRMAKRYKAANDFLQLRTDQLLAFIENNGLTPPPSPENEYKRSPDKLDDSPDGVVDPPLVIGDVPDGDVPTP